jgi:hypothetical protein
VPFAVEGVPFPGRIGQWRVRPFCDQCSGGIVALFHVDSVMFCDGNRDQIFGAVIVRIAVQMMDVERPTEFVIRYRAMMFRIYGSIVVILPSACHSTYLEPGGKSQQASNGLQWNVVVIFRIISEKQSVTIVLFKRRAMNGGFGSAGDGHGQSSGATISVGLNSSFSGHGGQN